MKIEYIIPKKKTNIHDFIKKYRNKTFLLKSDKRELWEIEIINKAAHKRTKYVSTKARNPT